MPVITYAQAVAQDVTSQSITRCAAWNADRAANPMSLDTHADTARFYRQAKELDILATHLRDQEDVNEAGLAA